MCKFISFWHNPHTGDLAFSDLESHAGTQGALKLGNQWNEAHYTPDGEVELRFKPNEHVPENYVESFKEKYPRFVDFLHYALMRTGQEKKYGGSLDVSGCDLKGVKLPQSIGGSLDVRGCDLDGVELPKNINIYK